MTLLRNPLVAAGLVLLVVGTGNIWVGTDNVAKYEAVLDDGSRNAAAPASDDFPHLDERMMGEVLRPLRHQSGTGEHTRFKLEFYRVVETGGYTMNTVGLGCIAIGLLLERRRRRSSPSPAQA